MTPEERSLLQSTHELAKDNNDLLRKLYRRSRVGTALKILYWAVIIGLSFGAFYFIQPYIDFVKNFGHSTTTPSHTSSLIDEIRDWGK